MRESNLKRLCDTARKKEKMMVERERERERKGDRESDKGE
jgi:hypothetical protein